MTVLGGIGVVAFAVIFLRLWYLEVLSGDEYLAKAQNNQVREFTVQAPRGKVVDRREVARRVAEEDIPDDPPKDLAIAGLGQAGDDVYRRGLEGLAQ